MDIVFYFNQLAILLSELARHGRHDDVEMVMNAMLTQYIDPRIKLN